MNVALPQRLATVLRSVEAATQRNELQDAVLRLRDVLGIDHLIYHWVSNTGDQFAVGTYSPEWAARYMENDYQRIDPVIIGAYQRFHPLDWRRLDWSTKPAKALMEAISEHTLRVYIESARHKLGAINTIHAVARALTLGLIIL